MRDIEPGTTVWNTFTGERGEVLGMTSWGDVRVSIDVDSEDYRFSVIGPPSAVSGIWERIHVSRFDPNESED